MDPTRGTFTVSLPDSTVPGVSVRSPGKPLCARTFPKFTTSRLQDFAVAVSFQSEIQSQPEARLSNSQLCKRCLHKSLGTATS